MMNDIENNSGRGKHAEVPDDIKGWNWGAFFLNWIWGIGNSTYIALLMFVPFVNFVMPFVLGAKGSEWAWKNRVWRDTDHFRSVQRKWAWAGLIFLFVVVPSCFAVPMTIMKQSQAYEMSLASIRADASVREAIGSPIETGLVVTGSVNISGPSGSAALQYSVKGPAGEGDARVIAAKSVGEWQLQTVVVDLDATGKRIFVVGEQ
jgi:hypothetical protein